jgi:hypothetical protein
MANFKGLTGKNYSTESNCLFSRGEGELYELQGLPTSIAKILKHDLRTQEREDKLKYMINNRPDREDFFAWPSDILYEKGRFTGFVMPFLEKKKELVEIIDERNKIWKFFVAVAYNLAVAVSSAHRIPGVVIGDFNPGNFLVGDNAMLCVIDVDSFHIKEGGNTYRCVRRRAEYIPAELQGVDLEKAALPTFTKASDHFALAVMVFRLLANSANPFNYIASSRPNVSGLLAYEKNIKSGLNPYFGKTNGDVLTNFKPLPDRRSVFPNDIYRMFERAFVDGHKNPSSRPSAEEWVRGLDGLLGNLKSHPVSGQSPKKHFYSAHSKSCPWCLPLINIKSPVLPTQKPTQPVQSPILPTQPPRPTVPSSPPGPIAVPPVNPTSGNTVKKRKKLSWKIIAVAAVVMIAVYFVMFAGGPAPRTPFSAAERDDVDAAEPTQYGLPVRPPMSGSGTVIDANDDSNYRSSGGMSVSPRRTPTATAPRADTNASGGLADANDDSNYR